VTVFEGRTKAWIGAGAEVVAAGDVQVSASAREDVPAEKSGRILVIEDAVRALGAAIVATTTKIWQN
jgi:hypothetical protein